jgi:ferrous-iron efflux pump FieF
MDPLAEGSCTLDCAGDDPRRGAAMRHTLWMVFWFNAGMAVFKVVFAMLGFNSLFVLDGLVSAALATHIATMLIGMEMARPAFYCRRYAYGKGKVQFLLALVLGGALVVAAAVTLGLTIKRFSWPIHVDTSATSVGIAIVAAVANLMLMLFLRRAANGSFDLSGRKAASLQILGIAASLSVLQSTILIGYRWLAAERIGRITIAMVMVYLSVVIIRNALEGVMDQSTGEEAESIITDMVASVERVQRVRSVRTRQAGKVVHVDVEVELDGRISVAESDSVAEQIRGLLARRMEQPADAINVSYCAS